MELSDVILTLVGIISAITGGVVKSLVADLKSVEKQISCLPKEYILKRDYHEEMAEYKSDIKDDIREIKSLIGKLFDKVEGKRKWLKLSLLYSLLIVGYFILICYAHKTLDFSLFMS